MKYFHKPWILSGARAYALGVTPRSAPLLVSALLVGLAVALSAACASKVTCTELGADWTSCPAPNADICVLKGKESACAQISGSSSSSSSSSSSGQVSDGGAVKCSSSFETNCSGKCVFLGSDEKNCGSCGRACPTGDVCFSGDCR